MTTKEQLKTEINQIDEAIEYLDEFVANLKAGNTLTKKAAKELASLIEALGSLPTLAGKPNAVEKAFEPVGKIVWDELPKWAIPRGGK